MKTNRRMNSNHVSNDCGKCLSQRESKKNMNHCSMITIIVFAFVALLITAPGAVASFEDPYADAVHSFYDGGDGFVRGVPADALGAPDAVGTTSSTFSGFVSIQSGEWIVYFFNGISIINGAGDDFLVYEYLGSGESANVYVSNDGSTFTLIGLAHSDMASGFDLEGIGWTHAEYVKIEGISGAELLRVSIWMHFKLSTMLHLLFLNLQL